jgi:hypothetical protein
MGMINEMKVPLDRKIQDLIKENEGFARQNANFINLYRQSLGELKNEMINKKEILQTLPNADLLVNKGKE